MGCSPHLVVRDVGEEVLEVAENRRPGRCERCTEVDLGALVAMTQGRSRPWRPTRLRKSGPTPTIFCRSYLSTYTSRAPQYTLQTSRQRELETWENRGDLSVAGGNTIERGGRGCGLIPDSWRCSAFSAVQKHRSCARVRLTLT